MAFFPAAANFMPLQVQTPLSVHHPQHQQQHLDQSTELPQHHNQHPPIFPSNNSTKCPSQHHFHGVPMMGLNMMSASNGGGGDDMIMNNMMEHDHQEQQEVSSDEGSQAGGDMNLMMLKKRRLNMDQVRTLEKNFELGNKLEPERKLQLARSLGLQPRQVAIWFQNRRARWKTKQLEKDYDLLKSQFKAIKADHDALLAQNQKLQAEIMVLKGGEVPTESINLNKLETEEGSSSNRSESSTEIKQDAASSRGTSTPAVDHESSPVSTQQCPTVTSCRALFPALPSSPALNDINLDINNNDNDDGNNSVMMMMMMRAPPPPLPPASSSLSAAHLFQLNNHNNNSSSSSSSRPDQTIKEESFCNMFGSIDDQSGFWTWLEKHHFN